MGVATANISNGVNGTVMSFGTLKDIDTRGSTASAIAVGDETWAEGDVLYAHPTVDGKLTKVRPQHDLAVAFITVRHASSGQLAVRIVPGNFHLEWLHDVEVEDPTESQILAYDETAGLWKNIDIPPSAGVVTSSTPPEETSSIWFNTETGLTYIYYDDYWTSISGDSGAPIISDTAPSSPVVGMEWFNSSNGKSYIYYSGAWVELDSNGTSTASTGNAIINGAFDIWQRGTAFANPGAGAYCADRWQITRGGGGTTTFNVTKSSSVPSTEFTASQRVAFTQGTSANLTELAYRQRVEVSNASPLAGKAVTASFWYRSNRTGTHAVRFLPLNSTGGVQDSRTFTVATANVWTRYTITSSALTSLSAWTVADNEVGFIFDVGIAVDSPTGGVGLLTAVTNDYFEVTGIQLEAGATATPFRRNAPSIQAELAACQRYYQTWQNSSATMGMTIGTTWYSQPMTLPVEMRVTPAYSVTGANPTLYGGNSFVNVSSFSAGSSSGSPENRKVWQLYANMTSTPNNYQWPYCTFSTHGAIFNAEL
jgi:hypothetical protein